MSKKEFIALFFIAILILDIKCALLNGSDNVSLTGTDYNLSWVVDDVALTITFTMDVASSGWIGMGFSTGGTMLNSDMYIGSMDGNDAVLGDLYNTKQSEAPKLDTALGGKSNISNLTGSFANGRTKITFTRPLNTGDSYDTQITQGQSLQMIFAYNSKTKQVNGVFPMHDVYYKRKLVLWKGTAAPTPAVTPTPAVEPTPAVSPTIIKSSSNFLKNALMTLFAIWLILL